ncbi:unnamed protein product [Caenorhabditis brenneri]
MIIVQHQQKEVSKTSGILFLILSNILYIIIPLYLLVIAAFSITKCPSNQFLPLWPVIVAVLIIIDRVIFWKILYNETKFEKNFPRPEIDDLDHIRAWEKDRLRSSSKILVLLKTNLRIVFFLAVLFGLVWSHDLLFKNDQCKPLLVFSIFLFSFVSLVCYLVSFIGTIYIHVVSWLSRMDDRAKMSLRSVM